MNFSSVDHDAHASWVEQQTDARIEHWDPIAPGLGHRRFYRVALADGPLRSVILRIEPPGDAGSAGRKAQAETPPDEPPMEPIRRLLEDAGIPVPMSHGHDLDRGLDLLEDVGERTLENCGHPWSGRVRKSLYRQAVSLIPALQRVNPVQGHVNVFDRRLDRRLVASKATKFAQWFLPEALGRPATRSEAQLIHRAFDDMATTFENAPQRLSHRDYKAANLHIRGCGMGEEEELVLIDLQGAFLAPPEYDLVCLLRDNHVSLDEPEIAEHLARVRPLLPDRIGADEFASRFNRLTVPRVAKDISHYVHAFRTGGDDRYLGFVANGLRSLRIANQTLLDEPAQFADFVNLVSSLPVPKFPMPPTEGEASCVP